jgi:hypothetical protein
MKPRFSLEGWEWKSWLKGNWDTIKETVKMIGAALGFTSLADFLLTVMPMDGTQGLILRFIVAGIIKLALDTIDYWTTLKK